MKFLKVMLIVGLLTAVEAFAGITHPCTGDQFETVELGDIRLLSHNRQLEARLKVQKVINKNCMTVIHERFNLTSNIVTVTDGETIFPTLLDVVLQSIDAQGELIESAEGQAPFSRASIRLLDGARAVQIRIDGFEPVQVEL